MSADLQPARRMSRRNFLRRGAWGGAGFLTAGAGLAQFGERNYPRVRRLNLPLRGLPPALEGLTVCQLSDLHRGPLVGEEFLSRAAEMATALRPDVIVVTGDFLSDYGRYAGSCARSLARLQARLGVYGVLGNHDHWTHDVESVAREIESSGLRLLTNRSARLRHNGADWWLAGVDDQWAGQPSLDLALRDVPEDGFRLLLSHAPDFADEAAARGIPLQLSGHSHGGQVLLPGGRPLVTPNFGRKYPVGLRRVEGTETLVYTNVGLGVIFPPIRINCPPEITLVTLKPAVA